MKQSKLFTKTRKEAPSDEVAKNAQLLIRGGFVYKEMAGVYSLLPLGLRVLENIKQIIREELNEIGGQELKLTTLQQKEVWEKTDRWRNDLDEGIWFKTRMNNGTELGLAFTHEEALTNIMRNFIHSYKELPVYAYQFQTKFRNELRAKAGLLRGREFLMKDLYDFSLNKEEHEAFYEKMKGVYKNIFKRIGIGDKTFLTISNGGTFSKYSFEFQTICESGEDSIVFDKEKGLSINKDDYTDEVLADFGLNKDEYSFEEAKSIEVGDIYNLGTKYSEALGLTYKDEEGKEIPVYMGSYGIGITRVLATVVELFSTENAITWPKSVSPYDVHVLSLDSEGEVFEASEKLYTELQQKGLSVLLDDRNARPGEKFADADLIGIPHRIVIGKRTLADKQVEYSNRIKDETINVDFDSEKLYNYCTE